MKLPYNSKGVLSDTIASGGVRLGLSCSAFKRRLWHPFMMAILKIDFVLDYLEYNILSEIGWFVYSRNRVRSLYCFPGIHNLLCTVASQRSSRMLSSNRDHLGWNGLRIKTLLSCESFFCCQETESLWRTSDYPPCPYVRVLPSRPSTHKTLPPRGQPKTTVILAAIK